MNTQYNIKLHAEAYDIHYNLKATGNYIHGIQGTRVAEDGTRWKEKVLKSVPNYLARLWYRLDKTYKVCQGIYNNYHSHSHCVSGFVLNCFDCSFLYNLHVRLFSCCGMKWV